MYPACILKSMLYISRSIAAATSDAESLVELTIEDTQEIVTRPQESAEEKSIRLERMEFIKTKGRVLRRVEGKFKLLFEDNGLKFYTVLDNIIAKYINKRRGCFTCKQKELYVYEKKLPIEEHVSEFFGIIKRIKEAKLKNNALAALKVLEDLLWLFPHCFELTKELSEMVYKAKSSDVEDINHVYKLYCSFKQRLFIANADLKELRCNNELFYAKYFDFLDVEKFFKNTDGFYELLKKELNSAYVTINAFINELMRIDTNNKNAEIK
ncbi:hypothetical protein ENBRE01_0272 [Enteropsectra breve]|nr:hypothetical protein ENBRE01_0272 [Enteropsectra breve]